MYHYFKFGDVSDLDVFSSFITIIFLSQKKGEFSCDFPVTIGDFFGKKDVEISRDVLDGLILSLKQTAHLCNLDCFENVCTILKETVAL